EHDRGLATTPGITFRRRDATQTVHLAKRLDNGRRITIDDDLERARHAGVDAGFLQRLQSGSRLDRAAEGIRARLADLDLDGRDKQRAEDEDRDHRRRPAMRHHAARPALPTVTVLNHAAVAVPV